MRKALQHRIWDCELWQKERERLEVLDLERLRSLPHAEQDTAWSVILCAEKARTHTPRTRLSAPPPLRPLRPPPPLQQQPPPAWPTTRSCSTARRTTPCRPYSPLSRSTSQGCTQASPRPTLRPPGCRPPSCPSCSRRSPGPRSRRQMCSCRSTCRGRCAPSSLRTARCRTTPKWSWSPKICGRSSTGSGRRWSSRSLAGKSNSFESTSVCDCATRAAKWKSHFWLGTGVFFQSYQTTHVQERMLLCEQRGLATERSKWGCSVVNPLIRPPVSAVTLAQLWATQPTWWHAHSKQSPKVCAFAKIMSWRSMFSARFVKSLKVEFLCQTNSC